MKKMKRGSLVTAVLLTISLMLTACGTNKVTTSDGTAQQTVQETSKSGTTAEDTFKPDISKEVKLKMYLLSDKPVDADVVYAEVNKKLKQDINATVDVNFISWAEEATKYNLLFASGEDFDLVYTADWESYGPNATKDAFMPLTEDILQKYAPKTFEEVPQNIWAQAKVNGKIFMVPYTKKEYNTTVAVIRGDLRQKYNLPELKSLSDVEKYLDTIAANEKDMIVWGDMNPSLVPYLANLLVTNQNYYYPVDWFAFCYRDQTDKTGKVLSLLDNEFYNNYLNFFKKTAEWYKKGYWSKSALTSKSGSHEQIIAGKAAFEIVNCTNVTGLVDKISQTNPAFKTEVYDVNFTDYTFTTSALGNGIAINAKSKNPERALMMLDLFRNDQSYFDLTTYGIKGKHYDLTADGKLLAGPEAKNFAVDSGCPWGWRTNLYRVSASNSDSLNTIIANYDKKAFVPPLVGFAFNNQNLKTEFAGIKQQFDTYYQLLGLGMDENPEARMAEWLTKVKAVGYEKYVTEVQNQMTAYANSLGN